MRINTRRIEKILIETDICGFGIRMEEREYKLDAKIIAKRLRDYRESIEVHNHNCVGLVVGNVFDEGYAFGYNSFRNLGADKHNTIREIAKRIVKEAIK